MRGNLYDQVVFNVLKIDTSQQQRLRHTSDAIDDLCRLSARLC